MDAQSHALMITRNVQPVHWSPVVKNRPDARLAKRTRMVNAVRHPQTALLFVSPTKQNVSSMGRMITAAHYREYALMLLAIITAIYARCIVQENAKKTNSAVRDKNPIRVAQALISVFQCQRNFGEMTMENGAPRFVPFIVKNGSNFANLCRILVMDAQQRRCVNQKPKMKMESIVQWNPHLTVAISHARRWMEWKLFALLMMILQHLAVRRDSLVWLDQQEMMEDYAPLCPFVPRNVLGMKNNVPLDTMNTGANFQIHALHTLLTILDNNVWILNVHQNVMKR
jgi:hypothetical protein